jgi:hypothetical protein
VLGVRPDPALAVTAMQETIDELTGRGRAGAILGSQLLQHGGSGLPPENTGRPRIDLADPADVGRALDGASW